MPKATGVTHASKLSEVTYAHTPYDLGSLYTENKWGNLCPSELES